MAHDLFVTLDFPPAKGGVARYYASLLRVCADRSITVFAPSIRQENTVLTFPKNVALKRKTLIGPQWVWPRWLPLFFHVLWFLARTKVDVLHVGQVLPIGTVALIARRLFGTRYCVYLHGLDILNATRNTRKQKLAKKILRDAARVVCNSNATKKLVSSLGIPEKKIILLLPGCTLIDVRPDPAVIDRLREKYSLNNTRVILSIARIVERKGLKTAIDAFTRIAARYPDTRHVIIGEGPERATLEAYVKETGLGERIIFCGEVPDLELIHWYALCTIFLLVPTALTGSDMEGFGIVYLEANAFKKPVVASRTGGVEEAVFHERTGLIVPPDNAGETANALQRLLDDPALAEHLGNEGRNIVAKEGTWENRSRELRSWLSQPSAQNRLP